MRTSIVLYMLSDANIGRGFDSHPYEKWVPWAEGASGATAYRTRVAGFALGKGGGGKVRFSGRAEQAGPRCFGGRNEGRRVP